VEYVRVTWLQNDDDLGGTVTQYRIHLNGTQAYDDHTYRLTELEQTRGGIPPSWIRVVDVACMPGRIYEVTITGKNPGGWSNHSEALMATC